jgi:hypothetical protein
MANGMQRQKAAKDWIGDAVKREGRVRKYLGVPKGEKIPMSELDNAIRDLKGRKDGDKSLLAALQLAKRFKQPGGI